MSADTKHLVVVISGHGYGHAVMTAPLINALCRQHPQLKITLKTALPRVFLEDKFDTPFAYLPSLTDFGIVMRSAFQIEKHETLKQYQRLHKDWASNVAAEASELKQLKADCLISNIGYLPLAAAKQLGLPCVAYSCLNWADIFHHYFSEQHGSDQIYQQMLDAYVGANCFIRTEPAMPMTTLTTQRVGPIASHGQNKRPELLAQLGLSNDTKLVLATMGGIETEMKPAHWPVIEGLHYLLPNINPELRRDISTLPTRDFCFTDLLCSTDVLLTKPGYGSFTQAAISATPVLYVERKEWPEQPYLTPWLSQHTACKRISREQFSNGDFATELLDLLQQNQTLPAPAPGLSEALKLIEKHLGLA